MPYVSRNGNVIATGGVALLVLVGVILLSVAIFGVIALILMLAWNAVVPVVWPGQPELSYPVAFAATILLWVARLLLFGGWRNR